MYRMDRRIIIAALCLVITITLPLIRVNIWQSGGADQVSPPAPPAPTVAAPSTPPTAVSPPPPAAPAPPSSTIFNFVVNNKSYTVDLPLNPMSPIKINSRQVNPITYTFSDSPSANLNIVSLRGKAFNIVDALTYLVMFPAETPLINRINKYNVQALNNAVNAIVSAGKYRRSFKIIKPTSVDSVVLASSGIGDAPLRLYTAKRGEKVSPKGTFIDVSTETDLELKRRLITNKENNKTYNCSTVEGATEFLTDFAINPSLTGCHYEAYGYKTL